jgi:hypothetical protein
MLGLSIVDWWIHHEVLRKSLGFQPAKVNLK